MDNKDFADRENIYLSSFSDFFQGFKKNASEDCQKRFVQSLKDTLSAFEEENFINKKGKFDSVEQYIKMKRNSGTVIPALNLIEITGNVNYSHVFLDEQCKKLEKLIEISNDQICYINDYFSYEREKLSGEIANLAIVYKDLNNTTEEEALKYVFNQIEDKTSQFEQIYQSIDPIREKELKDYAEEIIYFMAGHIH
jgi:hypothetical protein